MDRRIALTAIVCIGWTALTFAVAMVRGAGAAGEAAGAVNAAILPAAAAGVGGVALLALWLWHSLRRRVLGPAAALGRDVRTLLQARSVDRAIRVPARHGLGDLPGALEDLVSELRGARREVVRAMATATARTEQEKGWLELILLELVPQGVLVCNLEHRVLLYNRAAARLFQEREALGLGRSVVDLIGEEPLRQALRGLELRLKSGRRDLATSFSCATPDRERMLQGRVALVVDASHIATGYALSLEDMSEGSEARRAGAMLRRAIDQDLRGPLASLRVAAEALTSGFDVDEERRQRFEAIIADESARLSETLERCAHAAEQITPHEWPMSEIHSPDLLAVLAHRLAEVHQVNLAVHGDPTWLVGDSHLLMCALADLAGATAAREGLTTLEIQAGQRDQRSFVQIEWNGRPVGEGTLGRWLDAPLSRAPESTVRDVLERHGSEPWSRAGEGPGRALLHVPMRTASMARTPEAATPANPELYDFDLMYAQTLTGELGSRRLKELSYVVFDTETTGLRPAGGDAIISIAGVRVTRGRIISGETFTTLIDPGRPIPKDSTRFHGITDDMVVGQPGVDEVLPRFVEFVGDAVLVAHNAAFDMKFLKLREPHCGVRFDNPVVDTLLLSLLVEGPEEDLSLDGLCERLDIRIVDRHSALGDAMATAHVLVHLLDRLEARGIHTFAEAMTATDMDDQLRARAHHF